MNDVEKFMNWWKLLAQTNVFNFSRYISQEHMFNVGKYNFIRNLVEYKDGTQEVLYSCTIREIIPREFNNTSLIDEWNHNPSSFIITTYYSTVYPYFLDVENNSNDLP